MKSPKLNHITTDILVVGAGGAGIMAALQAATAGMRVICVTKVHPLSSHTVAAKGGINAALGNVSQDDWRWHMYDTIKGSDWLADQDAVEFMCKNAGPAIKKLEQMGVPFSRDAGGKIYQRIYGGQVADFGKGAPVYRACSAADRTGHAILSSLYQQALKNGVQFYENNFALDLLMDAGECNGIMSFSLDDGCINIFSAKHTIIATGGYGQIYKTNTSSAICTGDGNAMVLRAGLPLSDMEFVQFHPTGLYNLGFLVTEAARGEGAYLTNVAGEKFMAKYAPNSGDLASRDVIARAMALEIKQGRGAGASGDYLWLNLMHLDAETLNKKLPEVVELAKKFVGINVAKQPIPIAPSVHYSMGGIPTNINAQVLDKKGNIVPGLMAIGEAACVSVHGANRLGCNSLLDLIVFGMQAADTIKQQNTRQILPAKNAVDKILYNFNNMRQLNGNVRPADILESLKTTMAANAGVFRDKAGLNSCKDKIMQLIAALKNLEIKDKSLIWNNSLIAAFELENMLLQALATVVCAENRKESRGSHFRDDYPLRDDKNFLCHSIITIDDNNKASYSNKKVSMGTSNGNIFLPEERGY